MRDVVDGRQALPRARDHAGRAPHGDGIADDRAHGDRGQLHDGNAPRGDRDQPGPGVHECAARTAEDAPRYPLCAQPVRRAPGATEPLRRVHLDADGDRGPVPRRAADRLRARPGSSGAPSPSHPGTPRASSCIATTRRRCLPATAGQGRPSRSTTSPSRPPAGRRTATPLRLPRVGPGTSGPPRVRARRAGCRPFPST